MKQVKFLLIVLITSIGCTSYAQYFSNLYIQGRPAMLFGSIQEMNGTLYVSGATTTVRSPNYIKAVFSQINMDGSVDYLNFINDADTDTYAIPLNSLKKSSDGNFIAIGIKSDSAASDFLMKVDTSGSILFWHQYQYPGAGVYNGQDVVEIPGKGYMLAMNIDEGLTSYVLVIRTDTAGNVLHQMRYSISYDCWPWVIRPMYNGHYLVGAWSGPLNDNTPYLAHTWLIEVDSMGNEIRNWLDPDPTNLWPKGMEQTPDSGWIITRQHVAYDISNYQEYNASILKLDKNFNKQWDLHLGDSSDATGFYDIKILPDGKYVACGTTPIWGSDSAYYWGWLVKINADGTVLWDRKYTAFTEFGAHSILNSLQYLSNGNIVACGQLNLTFIENSDPGQQGWIIETDSNGCLLDNCGWLSTDNIPPPATTIKCYPNPVTNYLTIEIPEVIPNATLQVTDNIGCVIAQQNITSAITQIPFVSQPAGIYFVRVNNGHEVLGVNKVVVMH